MEDEEEIDVVGVASSTVLPYDERKASIYPYIPSIHIAPFITTNDIFLYLREFAGEQYNGGVCSSHQPGALAG